MRHPNMQAGSILSFLVVGAVLVIVTGTVFFVASRNMNDDNATVTTPEVTLPGETDQSTTKNDDKAGKTSGDQAKGSDKDKDKDKDSSDQSATSESSTDASDKTSSSDDQVGSTAPASDSTATDVDELSQTGPADTAAQIIAVGGLSFAGAAFIRSRRKASL